jgi:hypothetical protein
MTTMVVTQGEVHYIVVYYYDYTLTQVPSSLER